LTYPLNPLTVLSIPSQQNHHNFEGDRDRCSIYGGGDTNGLAWAVARFMGSDLSCFDPEAQASVWVGKPEGNEAEGLVLKEAEPIVLNIGAPKNSENKGQ